MSALEPYWQWFVHFIPGSNCSLIYQAFSIPVLYQLAEVDRILDKKEPKMEMIIVSNQTAKCVDPCNEQP
jgi:hypothetical protein